MSRAYGRYVIGLLTFINFVNYLDRMVVVTMYEDLRERFGFSNGQLGALTTSFFVVHAVATVPLAWASDRIDRRKVIALGVVLWSAATLGTAWAVGFASMVLLRGMVGIGEAAYGPASNTILCEIDPKHKAKLNAIYNGGMFTGACAGLWLGGSLGFPLAFQLVALPGFVLGVAVLALRIPPRRDTLRDAPAPSLGSAFADMRQSVAHTLGIPTLRYMLISGVLVSFAAGGYITWIVDFTVQVKGLSQEQARPMYALITLTGGIAGVLAGGFLGDRWSAKDPRGRVLAIATGFLCAVPFCVAIIFVDHGWPFVAIAWGLMFFLPFYNGPMPAVIDDVVDDHQAAEAQAAFVPFLHILGTGSAATVVGVASEHVGMRWAFALPAAATLLAGIFAWVASRHVAADMQAKLDRTRVLDPERAPAMGLNAILAR